MKDPREDDLLEVVRYLQDMNIKIVEKIDNLRRRLEKLEQTTQPATYTLEVTKIPSPGYTPKGFVNVEVNGHANIIPEEWIK